MLVRSPLTVMSVLGMTVAGVTLTVSKVLLEGSSDPGEATPNPEGCVGSPPHWLTGDALLRGIGPTTTKSLELLSVSTHPLPRRTAAAVLSRAGTAAAPSKQFAVPYPTTSTIALLTGHVPLRVAVLATSATLALVALIVITPFASAAGRGVVPARP